MIYLKRILYILGGILMFALWLPLCFFCILINIPMAIVMYIIKGGEFNDVADETFNWWGEFFFVNYFKWYEYSFKPND